MPERPTRAVLDAIATVRGLKVAEDIEIYRAIREVLEAGHQDGPELRMLGDGRPPSQG